MKLLVTIQIFLWNKRWQYFDKCWLTYQFYIRFSLRHKAKMRKDLKRRLTTVVLCLTQKCWNFFELGGMVNMFEERRWILFSSLHELLLDVLPPYRLSKLLCLLIHFYIINSWKLELLFIAGNPLNHPSYLSSIAPSSPFWNFTFSIFRSKTY